MINKIGITKDIAYILNYYKLIIPITRLATPNIFLLGGHSVTTNLVSTKSFFKILCNTLEYEKT